MIQGKRLSLQVMNEKALNELFKWINDRQLRRMSSSYDTTPFSNHKKWFESIKSSPHHRVFGIYIKKDQLIGTVGLYDINFISRLGELRIRIGSEKFMGKGYGSEAVELLLDFAFRDLGLQKVFLQVFDDNARAIAIYKKMGFANEGTLVRHAMIDGDYKNVVLMAKFNPAA